MFFFFQDFAERAAVQIFHHQISRFAGFCLRKSEIGDVDDVRMAQSAGGFGFAPETLDAVLNVDAEARRMAGERVKDCVA